MRLIEQIRFASLCAKQLGGSLSRHNLHSKNETREARGARLARKQEKANIAQGLVPHGRWYVRGEAVQRWRLKRVPIKTGRATSHTSSLRQHLLRIAFASLILFFQGESCRSLWKRNCTILCFKHIQQSCSEKRTDSQFLIAQTH